MDTTAARLLILGRVQGVGYRVWAAETARGLGLRGWVRNRSDGTVEILATGPAAAVDAMADACRRGPPAAAVAAVERTPAEGEPAEGFELRQTIEVDT